MKLEKERKKLETERDQAWRDYDGAAEDLERKKDELIDNIEKRLSQNITLNELFTIKWQII